MHRPTLGLLLALSSSGCASAAPWVAPPVGVVSTGGGDETAHASPTCDVPVWEPPSQLVLAVPSVPSAAVTAACDQLAARARERVRAPMPRSWELARDEARELGRELEESGSDEVAIDPIEQVEGLRGSGGCVPAGDGAWALEPIAERFEEDERFVLTARVVYVDTDGGVRASAAFELRTTGEWTPPPTLQPVFDFDGDGHVELALRVWDAGDHTRLLTTTDEGVREIPLPLPIGVAQWIDADSDGRPDLLADRTYTQSECYEGFDVWPVPSLLLHAAGGLLFSSDDAVARRYVAQICPCPPAQLLARPRDPDDDPLSSEQTRVRIACARLWGASVDVVEGRLASEIDSLPREARSEHDVCATSLDTLTAFARAEPPLRLDR